MKKILDLVMQASYIAGLLCTLGGVGVRVMWHFHRAMTYEHQSWFVAAGTFFLCSLASYVVSRGIDA